MLWGISTTQIEQLKSLDKPQIPFPILSQTSGIVKSVTISEGSSVMEGQSLFELTTYNTLWVDAQFYSGELDKNSIGQTIYLSFENGTKKLTSGKVIEILPQLSPSSTITVVRIEFQNINNEIKPGMQANVLWKRTIDQSLTVPMNSVLQNASENTVWIKNTDGSYEAKMVHVGKTTTTSAEILHGLKAGDEIVTSGAYLLQSEFIFRKGVNPMSGHDMSKM
jgi:Cu(I)/Ag(I) efflux system membrane fusion protein